MFGYICSVEDILRKAQNVFIGKLNRITLANLPKEHQNNLKDLIKTQNEQLFQSHLETIKDTLYFERNYIEKITNQNSFTTAKLPTNDLNHFYFTSPYWVASYFAPDANYWVFCGYESKEEAKIKMKEKKDGVLLSFLFKPAGYGLEYPINLFVKLGYKAYKEENEGCVLGFSDWLFERVDKELNHFRVKYKEYDSRWDALLFEFLEIKKRRDTGGIYDFLELYVIIDKIFILAFDGVLPINFNKLT